MQLKFFWSILGFESSGSTEQEDLKAQKLKSYHLKLPISVFGLWGPQSLFPFVEPNDVKPKIDIKLLTTTKEKATSQIWIL